MRPRLIPHRVAPDRFTRLTRAFPRGVRVSLYAALLLLCVLVAELVGSGFERRFQYSHRLQWALSLSVPFNEEKLSDHAESGFMRIQRDILIRTDDPTGSGGDAPMGERRRPLAADEVVHDGNNPVFVIGESAAFGHASRFEDTFARRLEAKRAAKGLRVYNAGNPAASMDLVNGDFATVLARYSPRTIIVYTGNNQWIQWMPRGQTGLAPGTAIVLKTLADYSNALAGLEYLAFNFALKNRPYMPNAFQDHFEMFGHGYALTHPAERFLEISPAEWQASRRRFLDVFESSLGRMAAEAKAHGVRLILLTVPFNYRLSPAWKHPQFEAVNPASAQQVRAALHAAAERVDARDYTGALPVLDAALALDPEPPLLHYLRAEALDGLGRAAEAEAAYAASREHMLGNLGARLSVNERIRAVAARADVELVDIARRFDEYEHARGRYNNEDLIVDDCHPSALGHEVIADALSALF